SLTSAPRFAEASRFDLDRRDSAPGGVASVTGRCVHDRATDGRAETVGTHDEVAALLGAALGSYSHRAGVLLDGGDLDAESHLARRVPEHRLKVGAVDGDRALEQVGRYLGELAAGRGQDRASHRRCPAGRDSLADAEASECAHRVRKQRDPGANWTNLWRTLEQDN